MALLCRHQVPGVEAEHLLPAVDRLLGPVAGPVGSEEAVAGAVVAVELVLLAVPFQLALGSVDLLRVRVGVVVAEDAQQRAMHVLGEIDDTLRTLRRDVLGLRDDPPAPAVNGCVERRDLASHHVGLPAARAEADDADLTVRLRLGAQKGHRALGVANDLRVGGTALGPGGRRDVVPAAGAEAMEQMRRDGGVAVEGELADDLFGPLVPAGHVVQDDHTRHRSAGQRLRIVRMDDLAVVPGDPDSVGNHSFEHPYIVFFDALWTPSTSSSRVTAGSRSCWRAAWTGSPPTSCISGRPRTAIPSPGWPGISPACRTTMSPTWPSASRPGSRTAGTPGSASRRILPTPASATPRSRWPPCASTARKSCWTTTRRSTSARWGSSRVSSPETSTES